MAVSQCQQDYARGNWLRQIVPAARRDDGVTGVRCTIARSRTWHGRRCAVADEGRVPRDGTVQGSLGVRWNLVL